MFVAGVVEPVLSAWCCKSHIIAVVEAASVGAAGVVAPVLTCTWRCRVGAAVVATGVGAHVGDARDAGAWVP